MELLCAIFVDLPKPFQAQLFATINSTQKPVNKSLTYEMFGYNVDDELLPFPLRRSKSIPTTAARLSAGYPPPIRLPPSCPNPARPPARPAGTAHKVGTQLGSALQAATMRPVPPWRSGLRPAGPKMPARCRIARFSRKLACRHPRRVAFRRSPGAPECPGPTAEPSAGGVSMRLPKPAGQPRPGLRPRSRDVGPWRARWTRRRTCRGSMLC